MSNEPDPRSGSGHRDAPVTYVYDAWGNRTHLSVGTDGVTTRYYHCGSAPAKVDQKPTLPNPSAVTPAAPVQLHTFEFRLSASETQEQCVALRKRPSGDAVVATRNVRAYLTRSGDPSEAASFIGGIEVHAELRDGMLVCCAALSDFGPGDLVVVQVEAAVFER